MSWTDRYISAEYQPGDCWQFIRDVYRQQFNLSIGHYLDERANGHWSPVTGKPRCGDLLVFRETKLRTHVGIHVQDAYMIHYSRPFGSVLIEPYLSTAWKNKLTKCYRHEQLEQISSPAA